jgi:SpoVK/Ycf46/Vps4 family AAA+-type ATPase
VVSPQTRSQLDLIVEENRQGDLLRSHGLRPISKVLFCGPPGCGKTIGAEAIANALSLPLVLVRFDAVVSSYLGETAANLRKVFDFARSRQSVVLFDEFDAIGKDRADQEEHGELKRVVNSFLQMLDGFRGETLLISATNHQGLLDSALWRRFDEIVYFQMPKMPEIEEVLKRNLLQIGVDPDISFRDISQDIVGFSHSDVERIALQAVKATLLANYPSVTIETLRRCIQAHRLRIGLGGKASRSSPIEL